MSELKELENFGIITVIDSKGLDDVKIHYLDFVLLEKSDIFPYDEKTPTTLGLTVREANIKLEPVTIKIGEIAMHNILSEIVTKLYKKGLEYKLDYVLLGIPDGTDEHLLARRIIAKILMLGNLIATEGRRGPAHYAILSKNLHESVSKIFLGGYEVLDNGNIMNSYAGIKIFKSSLLNDNELIVGRKGRDDEPGFKFVSSDEQMGDYVLDNAGEEALRNLKYKIEYVGHDVSVITAKINFTHD